ncbi:MAG: glutamine-hydrolyzing GMP synthase [Spirochaetaceae bacterium]|nr:glutamine-hydrolyzing GMP synthase [Spirochaetaceae bacterium]
MAWQKIVVINFGNHFAHKITRTLRLLGFHAEIASPSAQREDLKGAAGIILSDGPESLQDSKAPIFNTELLGLDVPILGIGYGHLLLAHLSGGKVGRALIGEFGFAQMNQNLATYSPLLLSLEESIKVSVSHQDEVLQLPPGFEMVASTKVCSYAAIQDLNQRRFGFQGNIESKETDCGPTILKNFARFCGMEKNWDRDIVLELMLAKIRFTARDKKVLIFLSGGVDSNVAFTLLNKSLGQNRVLGIHIDNGFLRKNESKNIARRYREFGFKNFVVANAARSFLQVMGKEVNPHRKRQLEHAYFLHVQNKMMDKLNLNPDEWLVALNTLYSDSLLPDNLKERYVIQDNPKENVGVQGLIQRGMVIEPLKELYKDEVKIIGRRMKLQDEMIDRHPFPEQGLAINVLCSGGILTHQDRQILSQVQLAVLNLISKEGLQATSAEVLPVRTAGIQTDFRAYRFPVALSFDSDGHRDWLTVLQSLENQQEELDFELTEEQKNLPWYHIPRWRVLDRVSSFITDSLPEVSRVVVRLYQRHGITLKLQEGYCSKERLDQTREADFIVLEELKRFGWYEEIFQHLTINLPYASCPEHCSIVLRPVVSDDVETAEFAHMNHQVLDAIMKRLVQLPYVDAIYYDITNKPPAAFSWE